MEPLFLLTGACWRDSKAQRVKSGQRNGVCARVIHMEMEKLKLHRASKASKYCHDRVEQMMTREHLQKEKLEEGVETYKNQLPTRGRS